jgi:hypothetical protein
MPLDPQPACLTLKLASVTACVPLLADTPPARWPACITRRSGVAMGLRAC